MAKIKLGVTWLNFIVDLKTEYTNVAGGIRDERHGPIKNPLSGGS